MRNKLILSVVFSFVLTVAVFGAVKGVDAFSVVNEPTTIHIAPAPSINENKYFVFLDGDGQVHAQTSSKEIPDITTWESTFGYNRVQVSKADFNLLDRDYKVTITDGVVTSIVDSLNPIQPVPSELDTKKKDLETKFKDKTHKDEDIIEYLRILGGF